MEQIQRFIQVIVPLTLFNTLYYLYKNSYQQDSGKVSNLESPETLTNSEHPDKIKVEKPRRREREEFSRLPPWIRKIALRYGVRYLKGVTSPEGYNKLMSGSRPTEDGRLTQ